MLGRLTNKHGYVKPVPSHIFGLMFLCSAYLGWAAFGKILTGHNAFFWMDTELVKYREVVAAYSAAFVSLGPGSEYRTSATFPLSLVSPPKIGTSL